MVRPANLVLLAIGALPAFFLVGPVVLGDGGAFERMVTFVLALAVYFVAGAIAGYITRGFGSGLWLGAPAAFIALVLMDQALLSIGVALGVLVAAVAGAYVGLRRVRHSGGAAARG